MPTIHNIQPVAVEKIAFVGSHVEVFGNFEDPQSQAPVNVLSPKTTFRRDGDLFVPKILVPLSNQGTEVGKYRTTFITEPNVWVPGSYEIELSGYYPDKEREGNKISYKAALEVSNIASEQSYIELLNNQLSLDLPNLFLIDDPTKFRLSDGDLYSCLQLSVSMWNSTPPVTSIGSILYYEIDTMPYVDLLITGAEIHAINKLMMLEIWNTIQYNDDISFTIDRAPKLQSKWQSLQTWYTRRLEQAKKDAAIRATRGAKVLLGARFPLRTLRALSFNRQFSFVFGTF